MNSIHAAIITAICAFLASIAQILYKLGTKKLKFNLTIIKNYYILGGLGLYGVSAVLFIAAIRHGQLSVLYPIMATSYIWVSLFAAKYLKERMNMHKWLGIALILVGVLVINFGQH